MVYRSQTDILLKLYWARILYCIAASIPVVFVFFATNFIRQVKFFWYINLFGLLSLLGVICLCLNGDLIISDVTLLSTKYFIIQESAIIWGKFYTFYIVFQNIFFSLGFATLLLKYRKSQKEDRARFQYVILGTGISVLIAFMTNLFLPTFGIFDLNWVGQFTTAIWVGFITYAISIHDLFDIRFAIRRIIISSLNAIGSFFIAYIIYLLTFSDENTRFRTRGVFVIFIGTILITVILPYLNSFNTNIVDNYLFKKLVGKNKAFDTLANVIRNEIDLNVILPIVHNIIKDALGLKHVSIILFDEDSIESETVRKIIDRDELIKFIKRKEYQNLVNLIKQPSVLSLKDTNYPFAVNLIELGVDLLLNIYSESELIAVVLLGEKTSKENFTTNDYELISNMSIQVTAAVVKGSYFSAERQYNKRLQQKVEDATAVLRKQKTELQEKYQFEKDMMGIMGHELRTPMTVARGLAELVIAKIDAKHLDLDYADDKLGKIYSSIMKEADLIQTMLSSAHIDNKKVNLQISEVDLVDIVEYSMSAFKKDAKVKSLKLTFINKCEKNPIIFSDLGRVQEIVNNLVSNAVKYTNAGSVIVELQQTKEFVYVNVTDTGIGIPKAEMKNLGKKFYRIHQHLDAKKDVVRAGGTGLGLYVVKGLLEALGGGLTVKSEDGVGSVFSAYFPLKTNYHDNVFITDKPVDVHDMFENLGLKAARTDVVKKRISTSTSINFPK